MFCLKCKHEEEYHGQSGCVQCGCTLKAADVHNYGHDQQTYSNEVCYFAEGKLMPWAGPEAGWYVLNGPVDDPEACEIIGPFGSQEAATAIQQQRNSIKEPECLMDVFEQSDEQGKVDMYAEALSNIEQLEAIITEQQVSVVELRQALIAKDQENEAAQNRIEELEAVANAKPDKSNQIDGLVEDISNLETAETKLLDACEALLAVINEMKAGVVGQEKEWSDRIALAVDTVAEVRGEAVPS